MNSRPKTIFCDIDGTLWNHIGGVPEQATCEKHELLPNTKEAIDKWDRLGYRIILTTGRKESLREKTEKELLRLGIVYDILIMGIGGGDRILINDRKLNGDRNTAYAINVVRNKGIPHFDFSSKFVTISDDQPNAVDKPWGREELIEYNDHYVLKKLFMKAGECCSLQYHELKRETVYVLYGKLKLYIGKDLDNLEEKILEANDSITILPYTLHRMEGIEDGCYLEASTNELWDVVRLQDKYKREGKDETDYKS
jgi:mannose-6-phosphate isomerase